VVVREPEAPPVVAMTCTVTRTVLYAPLLILAVPVAATLGFLTFLRHLENR
jgi:hypothetical protein